MGGARIKAVLRRTGGVPAQVDALEAGGLCLSLTKGAVFGGAWPAGRHQDPAGDGVSAMTLREFLSDRSGRTVLQLICAGLAAMFLCATGTQPGVLAILLILFLLVFLIVNVFDFLQQRTRLLELNSILDGLDRKYLFTECVPQPEGLYERRLFDLARRAGRAMTGAVSDAQASQREYREYVERWVHEIKAPITAARLICRELDGDTRRKLTVELSQIEAHVERALFYARAENPEQDCLFRQIELEKIAAQAIENHSSLLIQNGIRVETEGLNCTVYTDEKWAVFILGQLLQNAARYRGEAQVITISAHPLGKQVRLTVLDNRDHGDYLDYIGENIPVEQSVEYRVYLTDSPMVRDYIESQTVYYYYNYDQDPVLRYSDYWNVLPRSD